MTMLKLTYSGERSLSENPGPRRSRSATGGRREPNVGAQEAIPGRAHMPLALQALTRGRRKPDIRGRRSSPGKDTCPSRAKLSTGATRTRR